MRKIMKFLPEYCTTCLWVYNVDNCFRPIKMYSELNLPDHLIQELEDFDLRIMGILNWNNPGSPSPMTFEERMILYE